MKYLLDTNICIAIMKKRSDLPVKRLQACSAGDIGISAITLAELRFGAVKSHAAARAHQALDHFLLPLEVADFDENAAHAYGLIRAELQKMGTPIGPLDTLIAAHAIALSVVLITNNTREFSRVSQLAIEDWT